jgi:hypothetical protein
VRGASQTAVRIVREGHKGLVVLLFREKRPLTKRGEVFQQTENVVLKLPSPEHRFHF